MTVLLSIASISCMISVALWIRFIRDKLSRRDLLVQRHNLVAPWGVLDVYLVFVFCLAVVPIASHGLMHQPPAVPEIVTENPDAVEQASAEATAPQLDPAETAFNFFVGGQVKLFAIAIILVYLVFRYRADMNDLGLSVSNLKGKIGMGLAAGLMLIPLAIGMMALLSLLIKYRHNTLDAIRPDLSWTGFGAIIFSVGIVTPVYEELWLRGIVQGCLQRWARLGGRNFSTVLLGGKVESSQTLDEETEKQPVGTLSTASPALWPIFISAAIFAAMHLGQGPAPIPLYFLAVGLGYLYLAHSQHHPLHRRSHDVEYLEPGVRRDEKYDDVVTHIYLNENLGS